MTTLWFDDLEVGMSFDSEPRTISDAEVASFCELSGDFHPLHTDDEFARRSPFGARLVHGAMVLSMATGMRSTLPFVGEPLVAFAEIRSWKFQKPVFIGDTLRAVTIISELTPTSKPGRGIVVQRVEMRNQDDEMVNSGDMVNLIRSRPVD